MANEFPNTVFRSSYWYGGRLIQLFVNYNVGGHGSFSFIIKKDKMTLISNLTKDEKLPVIRNMLKQLTPEELALVLQPETTPVSEPSVSVDLKEKNE
jgi:hypothetical protein